MKADTSQVRLVIGSRVVTFDVPSKLVLAAEANAAQEDHFGSFTHTANFAGSLVRMLAPVEARPPTERQLEFAEKIASTITIAVPEAALVSSEECGEFIDTHKDQYYQKYQETKTITEKLRKRQNHYAAKAVNLARWRRARELSDSGWSLETIATELEVTPPTITKYLNLLAEWEVSELESTERELIEKLLRQHSQGINPYEAVRQYVT